MKTFLSILLILINIKYILMNKSSQEVEPKLEVIVYEGFHTDAKMFVVKYIIAFQMTEDCPLLLTQRKLHTFAVLLTDLK